MSHPDLKANYSREDLILSQSRNVRKLSLRYHNRNRHIPLADIEQVAWLAVCIAADKFAPDARATHIAGLFNKFSTVIILREILGFVCRHTTLHIGAIAERRAASMGRADQYPELQNQLLAATMPTNDIYNSRVDLSNYSSNLEDEIIHRDQVNLLQQSISTLDPIEQQVIDCLYIHNLTPQSTSRRLKISIDEVSIIESSALGKLNKSMD